MKRVVVKIRGATSRETDPRELRNRSVVIVGLGYVGLGLGKVLSKRAFAIHGIDVNEEKLRILSLGRSPISDLSDSELGVMIDAGFSVSNDYSKILDADVVVVALPTPTDSSNEPNLEALLAGVDSIALNLQGKCLVVIESTVGPGQTRNVVLPRLESKGKILGKDFLLGFSPERINPGSKADKAIDIPKIVSGVDTESAQAVQAFYRLAGFTTVSSKTVEDAETAKLLENTYRAVNLAMINELAPNLVRIGVNIREAIRLARSKPFGFQPFYPGPGVGGHCIPVDPWYLEAAIQSGSSSQLIRRAMSVNEEMPNVVAARINEIWKNLPRDKTAHRKVLLLGMSYKADVNDFRGSPGPKVARALSETGFSVSYHDPFLPQPLLEIPDCHHYPDLRDSLRDHDLIVVLQDHSDYVGEEELISHDGVLWASPSAEERGHAIWDPLVNLFSPQEC